ncbi:MAG TPA: serine/threonine-protein kinase [Planctomycetota bacterium]
MLGVLEERMFASHPTEIGPYRVLEVLGQGGVGNVYLVQQHEPFRRKAALKLIKLGMDTREVLVRFAQERQMLASMNHPNIAKVFDAGQTDTGRPYFVMEYVAGEPITDYCDRHKLPLRERLELFAIVCRAIQHAHQRGILHRDVKPSNVLVSNQEGRHVPMVIDFGLAKVLRTEPASANLLTREGQFLGTPRYMSPEQIELPSEQIDTRADVYSLGVVLFELIVGEPPYERPITDGGLPKLLRSVKDEESTRPSTRLTRLRKDGAEVAEKRRTDRAALLAQVKGDLDWIVVKALERDRDRRYQSAAELANDVERYLRREPIAARPPSAAYRMERFVRRNPLAVGGLLVAVLALVLGSASSTFWYLRANRARELRDALKQAIGQVDKDVGNAHLWFEEAIFGDETLDVARDVVAPLTQSSAVVGQNMGASKGLDVRTADVTAQLGLLHEELGLFLQVTNERWKDKDAGRIGGELDQEYDAIYLRIQGLCDEIRGDLDEANAHEWERAAGAAIAVNGAFLLLLLVGSGAALRFWLKRA